MKYTHKDQQHYYLVEGSKFSKITEVQAVYPSGYKSKLRLRADELAQFEGKLTRTGWQVAG